MNNFHYFGLFLDTETKNRLMDMLTDNIDYNIALGVADKIFIDHCTLLHASQLHGNSEIYNYLNNRLEEKIQIVINGIGISDKAMAFRVDKHSVVCVNDIRKRQSEHTIKELKKYNRYRQPGCKL